MRTLTLLIGITVLAALLLFGIGCERKVTNEGDKDLSENSCFTCHGDDGKILAAQGEWQNSIHASGNNVDYTNRSGYDCGQCHDHQGFLEYLATGQISPPYSNVSAIHCFTCHAPHERGNLTLRTEKAYTLIDGSTFNHGAGNLCANCHHSRLSPTTITDDQQVYDRWGPHHGPQGDLVNGTGGYEFAGYEYSSTDHGVTVPDACVGCHMGNPRVHDGYKIGGHSFNMVDEESGSNLSAICTGCHTEATDFDYEGIQTDVTAMLEELATLLVDEGVLDGESHLPVGTSSDKYTVADKNVAGAILNFLMIEDDRSEGVHNPKYIKGLLESSIDYLTARRAKIAATEGIAGLEIMPVSAH